MICPVCASGDSHVTDTRQVQNSIRRRRECCRCRHRWTTVEIMAAQFSEVERIKIAAETLVRAVGQ
jgi:transcriptional regulator NrdR family protein